MDVVTLGSFILDDIYEYPPVRQPIYGIVGGAGTYAAIAARMFRPGGRSNSVGLIVHAGQDFPAAAKKQIENMAMHTRFLERKGSNTTRGSNVYDAEGNRAFAFITPNVKIYASMMDEKLLTSRTFHMICTPTRCIDLRREILKAREKLLCGNTNLTRHLSERPTFVWEPMEDSCRPNEMSTFLEAFVGIDVFSPNERELLALCGMESMVGADLDIGTIKRACDKLLTNVSPKAVVARCGRHGCVIAQSNRCLNISAYHQSQQDPERLRDSKPVEPIVDVTGGGNAFLGGFCAGLDSQSGVNGLTKFEEAALYGTVAASYAIEQVGVPQLMLRSHEELWNGTSPFARLRELKQRFERASR